MHRSPLALLNKYDITLTSSWETNHGISGHLFEMIEYFYHLRFHKGINACILIAEDISQEEFKQALIKYSFNSEELQAFEEHVHYHFHPLVVIANDMIFVDGSLRTLNADLLCKRKIFLRCSEEEFLDKADLVLQDYDLYDPLPNSVDYKKKILFEKFSSIKESDNAAMFYSTSNSRMLSYDDLISLTTKYDFYKYIIITNKEFETPSNVELLMSPVPNLWERFNTYIYTDLTAKTKFDCSSRFIAECKFYNKNVIYDAQRVDKGLAVRRKDLEEGIEKISLKENDDITTLAAI